MSDETPPDLTEHVISAPEEIDRADAPCSVCGRTSDERTFLTDYFGTPVAAHEAVTLLDDGSTLCQRCTRRAACPDPN